MGISMVINKKEGKLVKVCQSDKITKLLKNYYFVGSVSHGFYVHTYIHTYIYIYTFIHVYDMYIIVIPYVYMHYAQYLTLASGFL